MSRSARAHLKGEKEFSQGGYLAPPVMFAKRKTIPVERGDFSHEMRILRGNNSEKGSKVHQ
jgi:hypothetical protein